MAKGGGLEGGSEDESGKKKNSRKSPEAGLGSLLVQFPRSGGKRQ